MKKTLILITALLVAWVGFGQRTTVTDSLKTKTAKLQFGATVNEYSTDGTFSGNSDTAVPTEKAVKTALDTKLSSEVDGSVTNELVTFTSASSAPGLPKTGDIWHKSTTDSVFIRTSAPAWVFLAIRAGGGGGSLPSGTTNQLLANLAGTWVADSTVSAYSLALSNRISANPGANDLIELIGTWGNSNPAGNGHGFSDETTINKSGGVAYASFDGRVNIAGGYTYDHYGSHQAAPTVASGTTVNWLFGGYSVPTINGYVPQRFGYQVADWSGTGTVDENIGFKCSRFLKPGTAYPMMLDSTFQVRADGEIMFPAYGSSSFTTTTGPSYVAALDSWGRMRQITPSNLVSSIIGTHNVIGIGSASRLASWGDADSLTYAPVYVDNSTGAIGIGYTSAPSSGNLLAIQSGGNAYIDLKSNNNVAHTIGSYNANPAATFNLDAALGTYASPTAMTNGKYLGLMRFRGYDGTNMLTSGGIYMTVDGTPSTNNMPSKMVFQTWRQGFGGAGDRGAIDNRGRWGFGTTTPGYWMDVQSNFNAATALVKLQNSADSIRFFVHSATPEGAITGKPGDVCFAKVGGYGKLFVKRDNATDATGWEDDADTKVTKNGDSGNLTVGSNTASLHLESDGTRRMTIPEAGIAVTTTSTKALVLSNADSLGYKVLNQGAWNGTVTQSGTDTLLNSATGYGHLHRIGEIVTFTLRVEIALTNTGNTNTVYISPPVASNFSQETSDVIGTATIDAQGLSNSNIPQQRCLLFASTSDDKIGVSFDPPASLSYPQNRVYINVSGSYIVQ